MSQQPFEVWKSALDTICKVEFGVDTNDMGFDDIELQRYWSESSTTQETADYFGTKYNLTRVAEVNLGRPFD